MSELGKTIHPKRDRGRMRRGSASMIVQRRQLLSLVADHAQDTMQRPS
jgi:hypothetical protein